MLLAEDLLLLVTDDATGRLCVPGPGRGRCEDKIINLADYGLSRRELSSRAAQIANGNWASEAVRTANPGNDRRGCGRRQLRRGRVRRACRFGLTPAGAHASPG